MKWLKNKYTLQGQMHIAELLNGDSQVELQKILLLCVCKAG